MMMIKLIDFGARYCVLAACICFMSRAQAGSVILSGSHSLYLAAGGPPYESLDYSVANYLPSGFSHAISILNADGSQSAAEGTVSATFQNNVLLISGTLQSYKEAFLVGRASHVVALDFEITDREESLSKSIDALSIWGTGTPISDQVFVSIGLFYGPGMSGTYIARETTSFEDWRLPPGIYRLIIGAHIQENRYGYDGSFNIAYATSFSLSNVAVPEPSTCIMALASLACGGFSMWRRRKRA